MPSNYQNSIYNKIYINIHDVVNLSIIYYVHLLFFISNIILSEFHGNYWWTYSIAGPKDRQKSIQWTNTKSPLMLFITYSRLNWSHMDGCSFI